MSACSNSRFLAKSSRQDTQIREEVSESAASGGSSSDVCALLVALSPAR